jgi:hypothetical protein
LSDFAANQRQTHLDLGALNPYTLLCSATETMAETKITILVTETLRREAKAAAALRGETLSNVVRSALQEYVEETERIERDPKQALCTDSLLSLRFSGGPGDVAERVEEILAEAIDPNTGFGGHG